MRQGYRNDRLGLRLGWGLGLGVALMVMWGIGGSAPVFGQAAPPAAAPPTHTTDPLSKVQAALKAKTAVLVDVREQKEWDAGRVQGALLLPSGKIRALVQDGLTDAEKRELLSVLPKDKTIYFHCARGQRALNTATLLKAQGLGLDIRPLKPGFAELKAAGFPVVAAEVPKEPKVPAELNKQFRSPSLKADDFVKRFESESREVAAQRKAIVASCNVAPGMSIADIGAGTGMYTQLFADVAGESGTVYAVDIAQPFLKKIAEDAKTLKHANVKTVVSKDDSCELPKNSVDLVFICDTYHHFEKPLAMMRTVFDALRPGGRLVVIDFDRREGTSSAFILSHVRADQATFAKEIESAGFRRIKSESAVPLKENFLIFFEKPK